MLWYIKSSIEEEKDLSKVADVRPIGLREVGEQRSLIVNRSADFQDWYNNKGGKAFLQLDLWRSENRSKAADFLGLKQKWKKITDKHHRIEALNHQRLFNLYWLVASNEAENQWMQGPIELLHRTMAAFHVILGSSLNLPEALLVYRSMNEQEFDFPLKNRQERLF